MDVPAGMEGVFAFDGVSGCFGPRGLYMWGDGATRLIPAEEGCVKTPKKIAGIEGVKRVRISGTHVLVLCKPRDETVDETVDETAKQQSEEVKEKEKEKEANQPKEEAQNAKAAEESAKRDREERTEADAGESEAKKLEIGA